MYTSNRWLHRLKRVLFGLSPSLSEKVGLKFEIICPNRDFLEKDIFACFNKMAGSRIKEQRWLFVGIARYTWHYHRLTEADFQTIDSDPKQVRFARKGFHTLGSALELDRFYVPENFDVVIVNGVVGHGTDDIDSFGTLLTKIHSVAKLGAVVLLGYNEPFKEKFFDIESELGNSELFERFIPPIDGLQDSSILIDDSFQHRYVFLIAR